MTPYIIIAALLVSIGAYFGGVQVGEDRQIASQKKLDDVVRQVTEAAQTGAATAIAAQQPINRTIVQKAIREIQTNTVYADCRNTAGQLRNINAAITGQAEPAGDSQLPSPGAIK
jgi:hypothetical protein